MKSTIKNICLIKQVADGQMAAWHCAFRSPGTVGEET